jgi:predicted  nucleic acid-binding Zn-ribbon protein
MTSSLEIKKIEAERARVYSARLDLELRLEELRESVRRIEEHIQVQLSKEKELEDKLVEAREKR